MEVYSLNNIIQMIGIESKFLELHIENLNSLNLGKKYLYNLLIIHYRLCNQSKDQEKSQYMAQINKNICY